VGPAPLPPPPPRVWRFLRSACASIPSEEIACFKCTAGECAHSLGVAGQVEKQEACAVLLEHISSALAAARVSPHDHAGRRALAAPTPPCTPQLALSACNLCPLRTSTCCFPATERVVDAVLAAPPPPSARRGAAADKPRIDGVPPGGACTHAGGGAAGMPGAGRRVRSKFSSARAGMRVKTAVEVAPLIRQWRQPFGCRPRPDMPALCCRGLLARRGTRAASRGPGTVSLPLKNLQPRLRGGRRRQVAREELEHSAAAGGAAAKPKPKSRIFSAGSTPAFNF